MTWASAQNMGVQLPLRPVLHYFKAMKPSVPSIKILILVLLFDFIVTAESLSAQSKVNIAVDQRPPEAENLNVFQDWIRWNNPGSLRTHFFNGLASGYFDAREKEIAQLSNRKDWMARQEKMKGKLLEAIGPFPEKTPLNPKVTGVIEKEGYRIEKIVFESHPGFFVPGCLFIPTRIRGKAPAVLNVFGHEQESYHKALDQVIILNMVKKGIIVFAIDPLGQGEHVQYYDPEIKFSSIGYSVVEHSYFGNLCFLSGSSGAKYFAWDGIRAIDYLVSRQEVDPERIGVTGFSGGGTVTAYLGAFDPRVKVSVPCSWSTYNRRLMEMKGTQDAETILINGLKHGISFEDLLEVRAPKPTLLTFTSRDEYLSLQGAREAYREAGKAFSALGQADHLQMVEDDSKHWVTPKIRGEIYRFFMKHFGMTGDPSEVEVEIIPGKDLLVTPTGQISTSYGGDRVFEVNKKESRPLIEKLEQSRKDIAGHLERVRKKALEISGYEDPCCAGVEPLINGRYQKDGYTVTKYALPGEGDYVIPMLLFVPDGQANRRSAVVYLHPEGKVTEAKPGGEIEGLVKQGNIVAAADVLGVGETANTASRGQTDAYTGVLVGRSLVGVQAGDIIRVVNYLKTRSDLDPAKIVAVSFREMCLPLLHAAAFDPSIKSVILIGSLLAYRSVVDNRIHKIGLTARPGGGVHHPYEVDFSWGIAGVLKGYDLPDLMGCIAPRSLVLVDSKNQLLETATSAELNLELEFPKKVYKLNGAGKNLKIIGSYNRLEELLDWGTE